MNYQRGDSTKIFTSGPSVTSVHPYLVLVPWIISEQLTREKFETNERGRPHLLRLDTRQSEKKVITPPIVFVFVFVFIFVFVFAVDKVKS